MRTARDIIRIVIESIERDIDMAESQYAFSEGERSRIHDEKMHDVNIGMDYFRATSIYDHSIGFHAGCAFEHEEKIKVLRGRLNYWKSLDERCAEEEKLAEAEEDGEEDEEE